MLSSHRQWSPTPFPPAEAREDQGLRRPLMPSQVLALSPTGRARTARNVEERCISAGGRASLAPRSVGRLPEVERRALVVDALGEQPERPARGLAGLAADRPDPLDRGRDVIDAVRQPNVWLRALRRQDA